MYVRGGGQSYGRLVVDNGTVTGNKRTVLPSLGSGTAGSGSGGATLATGRSKVILPYFVGHWVEVRNTAGVLEGTWRIASIGVDGKTVTLAANGSEAVTVDEGDKWQGVYRFDEYTTQGSRAGDQRRSDQGVLGAGDHWDGGRWTRSTPRGWWSSPVRR